MDWEDRQMFKEQGRAIERLAKELDKLLSERAEEANAAGMDKLRQLVSDLHAQHTSYTNLVIAAGYAGSFAVWQFVDRFISPKARFWSALLLLLSLVFFVGYEIQKTVRDSWRMRHLGQAMLRLPSAQRLEAVQAMLTGNQLRDATIWAFIVVPTIATGLAGAMVLVAVFAGKLFGYTVLP